MTTSLHDNRLFNDADVRGIAARILEKPVESAVRIGGGLNSRVYEVRCEDGEAFVLKFYHQGPRGTRDRLIMEFTSLSFLWVNGIRSIPRPVVIDHDDRCAAYSRIEGETFDGRQVTEEDIDEAVGFLAVLKQLRGTGGHFPPASEAFFTTEEIFGNIRSRLERLLDVKGTGGAYESLHAYLDRDLVPFWDTLAARVKDQLGSEFNAEVGRERRTLSPSDFGFHNALRERSGKVVFLDFEHFGWDDPAKTIADFCLHPAMTLNDDLKRRFTDGILELFRDDETLKRRSEALYPVYGVKWCLIFLNEFVPGDLRRREFAKSSDVEQQDILNEQLAKARAMLDAMKERAHC